ncbi:MAG: hypothetical protein LBI03_07450, partial [Clostridiales bacterium]|nr:hypothetical protein [Clostridiales bacterium]
TQDHFKPLLFTNSAYYPSLKSVVLGVIFADTFAFEAPKKQSQCYDSVHGETPYLVENAKNASTQFKYLLDRNINRPFLFCDFLFL